MVAEPTTTNVGQTILNIMTKSQYDQITPSPTELYMVTDGSAGGGAVDDVEVNGISVVSGGVANITTAGILPSQASQSGKFLITNGTNVSWSDVDSLPSQTGQSGKYLTTNGTTASWSEVPVELPSQTGQSGKYLTTNGTTASWGAVDALPAQSGQSGKYLTTNGTTASWATVDSFPSQSGNSGKFLTTNGTAVSWADVDSLPSQSGQSGKYLTTNGTAASWAEVPAELPSQTGNAGKVLTTDGTVASWGEQFSRQIGEIVASTLPLTDAGLHLLDGALIDGSGIYSAFVNYISNLDLTANYFCSEVEWQTAVATYGVCGKFVYDSVNNTVRLPKITGIIEGTTDLTALGDLIEAGLPNIEGVAGTFQTSAFSNCTGAFKGVTPLGSGTTASTGTGSYSLAIDASLSNPIYGNSATVQPQAIKVLYYIVVATSTKTDIQVDIDEIATDLNGKVNTSELTECTVVTEAYQNGSSWYRIYSDGWCEQGGRGALNEISTTTITLLKPYLDTNYSVSAVSITASTAEDQEAGLQCTPISTTQITLTAHYINPNNQTACWQACGYIEA